MAIFYNCKDGDQLDQICRDIYGYSRGSSEAVISHETNRELAKKMPVLNAGDVVYLPDLAPQNIETKPINLWS